MAQKKFPLINSAHGSETRNIINELIKLFNGMGYTYNESLQKAQDILKEAQQTNDMNESVQQQINTLIAESGTSDAEVLQARIDAEGNEYSLLKARLDEKETKFESKVTKAQKNAVSTISHNVDRNVIVSFVDDDINPDVWTVLKPIFEAEGVPNNVAAITSSIDTSAALSYEQLKTLHEMGWTVFNHTHNHPRLGDLTEEEVEFEIGTAKEILDNMGFDGDIIAYPFGSISDTTLKVTRKHCVLGMTIHGGSSNYNTMPLETFRAPRTTTVGAYGTTLADCKKVVDEAPDNSWIIFYGHVNSDLDTQKKIEHTQELLQYIKSLNIDIVNLREGLERKGNIVDVGTPEHFYKVARDGTVDFDNFNKTDFDVNTPVSFFPKGESRVFLNSPAMQGKGYPESASGIIVTYRVPHPKFSDSEVASYQEYVPSNKIRKYRRRWLQDSQTWSEFEIVGEPIGKADLHHVRGKNAYSASDLISNFPKNKITTFFYNSTNSDGMPNSAGIVTTYRMAEDSYGKQEVREYQGNRIWSRYWDDSTSSWSAWEKISAV